MSSVILYMTVSGVGALKVVMRRLGAWAYTMDSTPDGSIWRVRARGSRRLSSDEFRILVSEVAATDGAIYEYSVDNDEEGQQ